MHNPSRFLIPNVTSAKNIGDVAMLEVLMDLIRSAHPDAEIFLQSSEPQTHAYPTVKSIKPSLYYWAVFESDRLLTRLSRMFRLCLLVMGVYFHAPRLIQLATFKSNELAKLVQDFSRADVIVFVGGGYLRSKKGLSQSLNVLMNLLPFGLAHYSRSKKIVAPISIGPFAQNWQKWLTARIIKKFDVVAVRERYSFATIKPYNLRHVIRTSDHALLVKPKRIQNKKSQSIIGFTIRQWLKGEEQIKLEHAYATALATLANKTLSIIQPIIQVDAPKFGEGDAEVTKRVVRILHTLRAPVLPTIHVKSVTHAKAVYGQLDLLVGMRMHSNILAAVQGVSFVAVSYEYKTEGIARDLELGSVCIRCEEVTPNKLLNLLKKAFTHKEQLAKQMNESLLRIQKKDSLQWQRIFQS